jgi:hypothetical protein
MVWSPILEVGKHLVPPTPQPPIVIGSPRYYQVTGLKPPKPTKTRLEQTTVSLDKFDTMSIDSLEKPILNKKPPKSNKLVKALGLKK